MTQTLMVDHKEKSTICLQKLTDSLDIANMEPVLVNTSSSISVAPDSLVFAVLNDFGAAACA